MKLFEKLIDLATMAQVLAFQTNRPAPRRVTRAQPAAGRPTRVVSNSPQIPTKTKSAICLLCLFDGLRTPSIRRLVRKPRVIFDNPLLTFDPSFYAPASEKSLVEEYQSALGCPCEMAVDPPVQDVLDLIKKHASSLPPQRIIIHYCGQGCHEPSEGNVYFFTEDRSKYKALKVANILNACASPVCFIFDCPNAACLAQSFASRRDVFAFFSCGKSEQLPLSVQTPMDLFSSCLLKPFETALWWHKQSHRNAFAKEDGASGSESFAGFLKEFLDGLLYTIAFETQPPEVCEMLTRDPAIASLFKGFVLAQRIMLSYNIHPQAIPELRLMSSHPLWNTWDIALDMSASMTKKMTVQMIFDLIIETFMSYPTNGLLPLFSFFLKQPMLQEDTANQLFNYMDATDGAAETASRCDLAKTIVNLETPTPMALVLLAKIMIASGKVPIESSTILHFTMVEDPATIAAGMLAMVCATQLAYQPTFLKLSTLCVEQATNCAPCSSLLFGLLLEKSNGTIAPTDNFSQIFTPMLKDARDDVRACACYVLGSCKNANLVSQIEPLLSDESAVVRIQALLALLKLFKLSKDQSIFTKIAALENDKDPKVKSYYNVVKPLFGRIKMGNCDLSQSNPIITHVMHSIKSTHFEARFEHNLFDIEMPDPPDSAAKQDKGPGGPSLPPFRFDRKDHP